MSTDQNLGKISTEADTFLDDLKGIDAHPKNSNVTNNDHIRIEALARSITWKEIIRGSDIYKESKTKYFFYLFSWGLFWMFCYRLKEEQKKSDQKWKNNIESNLTRIMNSQNL